jgi:hypothetical protein
MVATHNETAHEADTINNISRKKVGLSLMLWNVLLCVTKYRKHKKQNANSPSANKTLVIFPKKRISSIVRTIENKKMKMFATQRYQ